MFLGLLKGVKKYSSRIFRTKANNAKCFKRRTDVIGCDNASVRCPNKYASAAPLLFVMLIFPPKMILDDAVTIVGDTTLMDIKNPLFFSNIEFSSPYIVSSLTKSTSTSHSEYF